MRECLSLLEPYLGYTAEFPLLGTVQLVMGLEETFRIREVAP